MLTKAHLSMLNADLTRAAASGDPVEQRRAAQYGPLAEFCLWAHEAIVAIAAGAGDTVKALPEGNDDADPANFAGGTDGNPAPDKTVSPGKKSRGKR